MTRDLDDLWDYADPHGSERRFRELLVSMRLDDPQRIELLTQIARTHSLRAFTDPAQAAEAHAILDNAESSLPDGTSRARVRLLLERGRTFNTVGESEEAMHLFEAAWDMARTAGEDTLAIDAAHMCAIVCSKRDDPTQATKWNEKALALAQQSDQPSAQHWRGILYNNMGWDLFDAAQYEQALAMFERGAACRLQANERGPWLIARWTVARTLRALARYDEALAELHDIHAEHAQDDNEDGFVHEEMAETLLALNRHEEARFHFREAHRLLSQHEWLAQNETERLNRLLALGQT